MSDRVKLLISLYALPTVMALIFQFMSGSLQFNGEDASALSSSAFGFVFGIAFEGFVFILFASIAIVGGRFDK